jgi:hypothetical protein
LEQYMQVDEGGKEYAKGQKEPIKERERKKGKEEKG